ncbi:hypothetical protein [Nonlabens tegetincola]
MSIRKFEMECGITEGTLSKAMSGNRAIGIDKIDLITKRYPDVNAGWIVSGQGEMYISMSHSKVEEEPDEYLSTSKIVARIISTAVRDPHFEDDLLDALDEVVKKKEIDKSRKD